MSEARILWVGDNQRKLADVIAFVEKSGYHVAKAEDIFEGLCKLYERHMDLIIVSKSHVSEDKSDPLIRLRESSYIPIIVLGDGNDAARILELGADSFMAVPPDARELKARIDSLLRRKGRIVPPGGKNGSGAGSTHVDTTTEKTNLTPTENRISTCLELNKGRVMNYSQLRKEIWGGRSIGIDTLHYYIRRLKAKLSGSGIAQVRGVGYLMV